MTYDILSAKSTAIDEVARRLGIEVSPHRKARCISATHKDDSPSMSFDLRTNRFKCFGCGLSGDVIDLVQIVIGRPFADAINWLQGDNGLATIAPIPARQYLRTPRLANTVQLESFYEMCANGRNWLDHKGLDADTFGVRLVTERAHNLIPEFPAGGLFVPYFQHGQLTYGRWRNQNKSGARFLGLPNVDTVVYNQDAISNLDGKRPLYICEGETDTMSLATINRLAIGLPGATQYQLLTYIREWVEALGDKIPSIILASDNDAAGNSLTEKIREVLKDYPGKITNMDLGEHNDVNEWYQNEYKKN